jgi:hypothetical protein
MWRTRRRLLAGLTVAALSLSVWALAFRAPGGPRSLRDFDPDRMADLEVGMWQAYYRGEEVRLFQLLVTMLHEQYQYSWARSVQAGFHLARAAAQFANMRADYERVLPDLERAFQIARDWTHADFDPAAVARAELSWWAARRQRENSGVAEVSARMTEAYALLYGVPANTVSMAATLRTEAAALRDKQGERADWAIISELLRGSYRSLRVAVNAPAGTPR